MSILVTRSSMPPFEEYCEEIKELWDSRWLTNNGAKHKLFEKQIKEYLNVPNVTLFVNGHLALENIIEAMDFPEGGEVITTPFTFVSTTNAIVRSGLTPVFCDVKYDDYTIDESKIEPLINEKTCAIVPVHVYGNICNAEAIRKIADKYDLKVIYDAAHAFGVKYKGDSAMSLGDAAMCSFHATKVFNSIEGGAVFYKDNSLVNRLDASKNFGMTGSESAGYIGGNAKMNEFQAAMGICNLRHIEAEISKRKQVYERYRERLQSTEGIKLNSIQEQVQSNYAYFPVLFSGYRYTRDEVFENLRREGIYSRKYFYPLTTELECYKKLSAQRKTDTPTAKSISDNILCLPMYADLLLKDVDRICDVVLK